MPGETPDIDRRLGDAIAIPGDYQHRALTEGPKVQRFWHQAKAELLDWIWTPGVADRVLDVGCGSGVISDRMADKGAEVVGIDANPDAVAFAQRTYGRPGITFLEGYLDALDLPPRSFDGATCLEVIEHVYPPQVETLLQDLFRILRPGGRLLITTPNYRGLWPIVEWAADRMASTAHMDGDQHVTRFHRRMLRTALENAGFSVERLRTTCTFAPFVAGVWWRAGRWVDRAERRIDLPFGNILVAVARRP